MRTEDGLQVRASQRSNAKNEVPVELAYARSDGTGGLILSSKIGGERGIRVEMRLTLEEILAWLPKLTEQAVTYAIKRDRITRQ